MGSLSPAHREGFLTTLLSRGYRYVAVREPEGIFEERKSPRTVLRKLRSRLKSLTVVQLGLSAAALLALYGLLVVAGSLGVSTAFAQATLDVDLGYAQYLGTAAQSGVTKWLGLRFAAPPVGDLRFRKPQDPPIEAGLQIANQFGALCIPTGSLTVDAGHAEDCLFANVYSPTRRSKKLLPVYIFIQGGGFNALANPSYDATGLIKASGRKIVVVTFNYRVGLYGFLTSTEVQSNGDLNVGLHDQRKLFEWVQAHISKFGGDPNHVTIGGNDAGATSVDLHLSAYGGRNDNYFHAAISESQTFGLQYTVEQSQYQYDGLIGRAGCNTTADSLQCLRDLPISTLQGANELEKSPLGGGTPLYMYSNVIDGEFTREFTYSAFANNKFVKVPIIVGANTNDGTTFVPTNANTTSDLINFFSSQFPTLSLSHLSLIVPLYPPASSASFNNTDPLPPDGGPCYRATASAYGDMRYLCPGFFLSSAYTRSGSPSWNYRFNARDPVQISRGLGVPHLSELSAIWGPENIPDPLDSFKEGQENERAVTIVQAYWTSFIRSYNPNTYKLRNSPQWDEWIHDERNRLRLEARTSAMELVPAQQRAKCLYWEGIGPDIQQ